MLLQSDNDDSQFGGILAMLKVIKMPGVTEKLIDSDKFMGIDCSKNTISAECKAQTMCCENNYFVRVCLTDSLSF